MRRLCKLGFESYNTEFCKILRKRWNFTEIGKFRGLWMTVDFSDFLARLSGIFRVLCSCLQKFSLSQFMPSTLALFHYLFIDLMISSNSILSTLSTNGSVVSSPFLRQSSPTMLIMPCGLIINDKWLFNWLTSGVPSIWQNLPLAEFWSDLASFNTNVLLQTNCLLLKVQKPLFRFCHIWAIWQFEAVTGS